MTLSQVAVSDSAISIALTLCGAAWTVFRSMDWVDARRRLRFSRALRTLENAVVQIYEEYVRALKEGNADGRLTVEERRRARKLARDRAVALARADGVDLLRDLGGDHVDLWIARILRKIKTARQ
ncbi:MAG: hypothetical protein H3C30_06705 [Candidatus Hydrogenedentes bacterium]|nr:hypothetical protein [Candidatus Hydrogenedentota bacterium]